MNFHRVPTQMRAQLHCNIILGYLPIFGGLNRVSSCIDYEPIVLRSLAGYCVCVV